MSCKCCIKKFRLNDGLLNEARQAALEGKETLAADFAERAAAVAAMEDGAEKEAAALALYAESQAVPVTEDRIVDPVELDKIIEWSPQILSPFTYECDEERRARNCADAYAALEAGPQKPMIDFVRAFVKQYGLTFTREDVLAYLQANESALPCDAMTVAVMNAADGKSIDELASYANPFRADTDCLAIGAVFGIELAAKPDLAAKAAMTFASVMFLKAGVYGAMWMASLLAHALIINEPEVYMVRAFTTVPIPSVFFRKITWMQRNLNCGVNWEGCRDEVRNNWCENDSPRAVRSVFTNALLIAASLLYAQPDSNVALDYIAQCGLQKEANTAYVRAVLEMVK